MLGESSLPIDSPKRLKVAFQNRNPIHRAHFELLVCVRGHRKNAGSQGPGRDGILSNQPYIHLI